MKLLTDKPRKEKRELPLVHIYGVTDENNEILVGMRIAEWLLEDRRKLSKVLHTVKKMIGKIESEVK